jgi:hypothetical protein
MKEAYEDTYADRAHAKEKTYRTLSAICLDGFSIYVRWLLCAKFQKGGNVYNC